MNKKIMKTRYKIISITVILVVSFFVVPPNIAGFTCNELDIKADSICYIVGMKFFGVHFLTNIWTLYGWDEPIPCGGFSAEPGKIYTCSKPTKYWGF